jgi:hypothetical protein
MLSPEKNKTCKGLNYGECIPSGMQSFLPPIFVPGGTSHH